MTSDSLTILLIAVFSISILGLIGILVWVLRLDSENRINSRVSSFVGSRTETGGYYSALPSLGSEAFLKRFEGMRGKITQTLSFFSTDALRLKISSAYWPISDIEYILIQVFIVFVGLAVGWSVSKSILGGLGLGLLLYFVPGIILDRAIMNRRKKFQDQLLDFLVLIKGAVLAGYGLAQALDLAVKEIPSPASEEFNRVLREVKLGFSIEQALMNLADRMQSDDLQIVVTAIVLNSQMGGDLSIILEATIETIRDRIHLFSEIRSLTAYSRYVGLIISLLPLITGVLVFILNPEYFDTLRTSTITQIIFIMAFLGIIVGNIIIRRVMKIRV